MISEELNVPQGIDSCEAAAEQAEAPKQDGAAIMMSSEELYQTARPDLKKHFDIQVSGIWRGMEADSEIGTSTADVRDNSVGRGFRRTPVIRSAASTGNVDSRLSARAYQTIKAPVLPVFEKNVATDSLAVLKKLLANSNRSYHVARSDAQSKPEILTTEFVKPPSASRGFDFSLGHFVGDRNEAQINAHDMERANGAAEAPVMLSPESFTPQRSTLFSVGGGLKKAGEAPEMLSSESFTPQQSTLFSVGGGLKKAGESPEMLSPESFTPQQSTLFSVGGGLKKAGESPEMLSPETFTPQQSTLFSVGGGLKKAGESPEMLSPESFTPQQSTLFSVGGGFRGGNDATGMSETPADASNEVVDYGPILSPEELIESAEKNKRAFHFVINPNVALDMRRGYEAADAQDTGEREKDIILDNEKNHVNSCCEVDCAEAETSNELFGMAALCFEQAFMKMIRKLWAEEFYPVVERRIEARFERLEAAILNAHRKQSSDDKISSTKYDTNSEDFCI